MRFVSKGLHGWAVGVALPLLLILGSCSKTEYAKDTDGGDKPEVGGCVLKCTDSTCREVGEIFRYDTCAFDEIHLWEIHHIEPGRGQKCEPFKDYTFMKKRLSCKEYCKDDGATCILDQAAKCTGKDGNMVVPAKCLCP